MLTKLLMVRAIGVLRMSDEMGTDAEILAVLAGDPVSRICQRRSHELID